MKAIPPDVLTRAGVFSAVVFGLSLSGGYLIDTSQQATRTLLVEMRSDTAGSAQVFYDIGRGVRPEDSVIAPVVASNAFTWLRFALPARPIHSLRFDPIAAPASFTIGRAFIADASDQVVRRFSSGDFLVVQQIASRIDLGPEARFVTAPNASDPILQIRLAEPVGTLPWSSAWLLHHAGLLLVALLVTAASTAAYILGHRLVLRLGGVLDRAGRAVSDARFVEVDRLAVGWYAGLALFFVVAVAAGLHGSSMSLYSRLLDGQSSIQPILGVGRPVRSDEWAFHTPAILHQIYRADPLEGETTPPGERYTSLVANLPVKHVTSLFRPQFWGFFALPPAYAFSFYWQFKAVLLLGGVFALLLVLTRSSAAAAIGSLWYASSAHLQWAYSWASLLPDMIGVFCVVMSSLFYMSVGSRTWLVLAAGVICGASAVNFALCAYLPHQIPLVWLGLFLTAWWVWAQWRLIWTRERAALRLAAIGITWLVVAIVMFDVYRDAEGAIAGIANTIYPGQRSLAGGGYSFVMLFSHFFGFWTDEGVIPLPASFGNISESSGFFWLAPITIVCVWLLPDGDRTRRSAYWAVMLFGALLLAWCTLPVPHAIGQALFMDRSGAHRSVHVLGLVNVALVALCLSFSGRPAPWHGFRRSLVLGAGALACVYPVFVLVNMVLANFLTGWQVAAAAAYLSAVIVLLFENRRGAIAALLIVPQIAAFGLVNPLDRGLRVFESSPLFRFVHSRRELLNGTWIVYSPSVVHAPFFSAVGCRVVTGLHYLPDLEALSVFDPDGSEQSIVNQSGWLLTEPRFDGRPAIFEQLQPGIHVLKVNPLDPGLKRIGVTHAAFVVRPPPETRAGLVELSPDPVNGFYLYALP
jgi:hypothetical protein